MRKQLCEALLVRQSRSDMVFITGDLGFRALESLQAAMGDRFINAGVAEQNMISVAAALSRQQLDVWVYSIAPFVYARPFEQVRNDIAFHNLPVKLIGNGGGYAYGVMGPTHHAIDDYGALLLLPNMSVYVPAFEQDVSITVDRAGDSLRPAYIRLGLVQQLPSGYVVPPYEPYRRLTQGSGPTVVVVGPLASVYISSLEEMPENLRPNLWVVTELSIDQSPPPLELIAELKNGHPLVVAEEHVRNGGYGSNLLLHLASLGVSIKTFKHLYATAHHFETYGSQTFLRQQSKLDVNSMYEAIQECY